MWRPTRCAGSAESCSGVFLRGLSLAEDQETQDPSAQCCQSMVVNYVTKRCFVSHAPSFGTTLCSGHVFTRNCESSPLGDPALLAWIRIPRFGNPRAEDISEPWSLFWKDVKANALCWLSWKLLRSLALGTVTCLRTRKPESLSLMRPKHGGWKRAKGELCKSCRFILHHMCALDLSYTLIHEITLWETLHSTDMMCLKQLFSTHVLSKNKYYIFISDR